MPSILYNHTHGKPLIARHRNRWHPPENNEITRMFFDGMTCEDIAAKKERRPDGIMLQLFKLGYLVPDIRGSLIDGDMTMTTYELTNKQPEYESEDAKQGIIAALVAKRTTLETQIKKLNEAITILNELEL